MPEKTPAEFTPGQTKTVDASTDGRSPRIACGSFAKLPFARYRERARQPVQFRNLGVDIRMAEVDNPAFTKAARESADNPRTITAARNSNESPLVRLEHMGSIDARQARAGHMFRQLYERMMGGQRSPSFLQIRVDGGSAPDAFTESRGRASSQLRTISEEMTPDDYAVVRFVCGEGRSLRELDKTLGVRKGGGKLRLVAALDKLSDVLGLGKPKAKDG
ncbi:hypothetical protein NS365_22535 [Aureimonas ureilytica]|uniref:Uncharacterized protein n=1 Tax=Aureimonas ureilytica TaxID=401562 RepID=A0A175RH85_9HYPH|nr:hypothetical protein [Aureimonas ureilytica]KTR02062.1 hypothetical protein NS365_22535 [Aureimonas ureilytica]